MILQSGRPTWSLVALLAVSWSAAHCQETKPSSQTSQETTPTKVTLCQLLSKPEQYNGKEVVVRAQYNHGFEWSALHSPECFSQTNLVWLDLSQVKNKASLKTLGGFEMTDTFELTVQGIFVSGKRYGHLGSYRYQIIAKELSDIQKPTQPIAPKFSELSREDSTRLEQQRGIVAAAAKQRYGTPILTRTISDLPILQRLIDDKAFSKRQTYELQSLGVTFGDVLTSELPLRWVMVTDEYGTDPTLRLKDTSVQINALTMISKRIEKDEGVNLSELLRITREQLTRLTESGHL